MVQRADRHLAPERRARYHYRHSDYEDRQRPAHRSNSAVTARGKLEWPKANFNLGLTSVFHIRPRTIQDYFSLAARFCQKLEKSSKIWIS
jgi:hypothetical protein